MSDALDRMLARLHARLVNKLGKEEANRAIGLEPGSNHLYKCTNGSTEDSLPLRRFFLLAQTCGDDSPFLDLAAEINPAGRQSVEAWEAAAQATVRGARVLQVVYDATADSVITPRERDEAHKAADDAIEALRTVKVSMGGEGAA